MNVFIKCPTCLHENCFEEIPASRSDLAMFRGSEEPIKCRSCGANLDTMRAYIGERAGAYILRREDPK